MDVRGNPRLKPECKAKALDQLGFGEDWKVRYPGLTEADLAAVEGCWLARQARSGWRALCGAPCGGRFVTQRLQGRRSGCPRTTSKESLLTGWTRSWRRKSGEVSWREGIADGAARPSTLSRELTVRSRGNAGWWSTTAGLTPGSVSYTHPTLPTNLRLYESEVPDAVKYRQ